MTISRTPDPSYPPPFSKPIPFEMDHTDESHIHLSIMKHPDSLKPAATCDLCGKLIEMTATGGNWPILAHRGSNLRLCKKKEQARAVVASESRMIV